MNRRKNAGGPGRLKQLPLIDPGVVWDKLSPEEQRRFALAAIAHVIGANGQAEQLKHLLAFEAADDAGYRVMHGILKAQDKRLFAPAAPDLNAIGVRVCRGCGCTDNVGCPGGCTWIAEGVCSNCRDALKN